MTTFFENFEGFSQILKKQSGKKVFGCVYTSNSNNIKIKKLPYRKKNSGVSIVVDYADTGFSNFAIEYLRENEKVRETVFACSYGTQNLLSQTNCQKSRETVLLSVNYGGRICAGVVEVS